MSYVNYEQSEHNGHPQEIYRFTLGDQSWLMTSADMEVAWLEDTYTPVYIRRSGFSVVGDARKSTLEIDVSAQNPVALLYRSGWLSGILVVTIFRRHYGDLDYALLWKGRVVAAKWSGSTALLSCDSDFSLFSRAGLRRRYQIGCPHVLYSAQCGVDKAAYRLDSAVASLQGNTITITGAGGQGDGYYLAGMLQVGEHFRLIVAHTGDIITLTDPVPEIVAGLAVTLWPGCDRTMNTCNLKFNNVLNYGGLPFTPLKNPFQDSLV